MFIGDVEIPIVSDIIDASEAEVDEIKPLKEYDVGIDSVPVKHESSVQSIIITGFLNQETHSENVSLDEQKKEIKTLRQKSKLENTIDEGGYKGHLLVENVDVLDDGTSRIVDEAQIEARYFPWPKYFPEDEP